MVRREWREAWQQTARHVTLMPPPPVFFAIVLAKGAAELGSEKTARRVCQDRLQASPGNNEFPLRAVLISR